MTAVYPKPSPPPEPRGGVGGRGKGRFTPNHTSGDCAFSTGSSSSRATRRAARRASRVGGLRRAVLTRGSQGLRQHALSAVVEDYGSDSASVSLRGVATGLLKSFRSVTWLYPQTPTNRRCIWRPATKVRRRARRRRGVARGRRVHGGASGVRGGDPSARRFVRPRRAATR